MNLYLIDCHIYKKHLIEYIKYKIVIVYHL